MIPDWNRYGRSQKNWTFRSQFILAQASPGSPMQKANIAPRSAIRCSLSPY